MKVDLEVVSQVALNGALLIAALYAGARWFRSFVQKQVVTPAEKTYQQVAPNGGSQESTRHLIEQMASDMESLRQVGVTNRDIANAANAKAELAHKRLDEHIAQHPKE